MTRAVQPRPLIPDPPKPTPEDIAERLATADEYLWTVQQCRGWGLTVVLLLCGVLLAMGAIVNISGQQFYTFSGYGEPSTHAMRAFFNAHAKEGITLAQIAPTVSRNWPVKLTKGVARCLGNERCKRQLLDHQARFWWKYAPRWFPELIRPLKALWACAGCLAMALMMYTLTWLDVAGWRRWEQRERLAIGKARRERQRRG